MELHGACSYLQTERGGGSGCGRSGSRPPAPTPTPSPAAPSPLSPWLPLSFPTQPPSLPPPGRLSLGDMEAPHAGPPPHGGQSAGRPLSGTPGRHASGRPRAAAPSHGAQPTLPAQAHSHSLSSPSCLEKLQPRWPPPCGLALPEGGFPGRPGPGARGDRRGPASGREAPATMLLGLAWAAGPSHGAGRGGTDGHRARGHSTPRLGKGRPGGAAAGTAPRRAGTGQHADARLTLDKWPQAGAEGRAPSASSF